MTDRETKIRQNVQETLQAFDRVERITPDPWFHQRVMTGVQAVPATAASPWSLFLPRLLKPALLMVIVIVNVSFLVKAYQHDSREVRAEYVTHLVSDYGYTNLDNVFTMSE